MSWQTLASKTVLKNPWYQVRQDSVTNHLGKSLTYNVIELHNPSVAVVVCDDKDRILLQKNYRYTIDRVIWELPGGNTDGEEPVAAGKRELLEELRLVSDDWTYLGRLYQATGVGNMPMEVCLARNTKPDPHGSQEVIEQIEEQRFFSFEEVNRLTADGTFNNATVLGIIQLAKQHIIKENK